MRGWLVGIVVLAVGGGIVAWKTFGTSKEQYDIVTTPVVSGPITMVIETSGKVEPLSTVQVGCEVTGKIIELAVDDDDPVRKGQVICRIDPELVAAENQQSEADLIRAQSSLASAELAVREQTANLPVLTKQALAQKEDAEAALLDAEYQWQRTDDLYKHNNAMKAEWVLRKSAWERAKAALMAAEASYQLAVNNEGFALDRAREAVVQAKAALKLAEARHAFTTTRLARCTITSPIDGIVLKRYLDVGTTVTAAFQTPLLFLLAPSLGRVRVSAKVSESDISHIEVGQVARFTVEARQPVQFEGRIAHKYNQPEVVQNVVTYMVDFEVDNDRGKTLIPGLSVNVEIECVAKKDVPQVANAALRFKPPVSLEERRALVEAAAWPEKPEVDASGQQALYCSKAYAWQYDATNRRWIVVPLWVGVTDNINTEILAGSKPDGALVKKCIDQATNGFSLKEAMKLARPDNRTL